MPGQAGREAHAEKRAAAGEAGQDVRRDEGASSSRSAPVAQLQWPGVQVQVRPFSVQPPWTQTED